MTTEEYQCVICNNSTFKSRADWLVHLVLSRHSGKVARRLEKWVSLKRKEDLYLITNLDLVDNSLLLEYISDNLRTFSDIVFFKPRANICLAVGNETYMIILLYSVKYVKLCFEVICKQCWL